MKKCLLIAAAFYMPHFLISQTVISQWNFNSPLPPDFNLVTGSTQASMGNGVIRLIGNAGPSNANPFNDGSDNDYFTNGLDNSAWNITRFPVQGTGNKTAGIQFAVNAGGFSNIQLKFDEKHSNSSANTTVVQYNPDTANAAGWTDIQTNTITPAQNPFASDWMTHAVDLSAISSVNNQPRLGFRIVSAFDPANGANYISTLNQTAASYSATGGTIRWDMITITGTPLSGCTTPAVQASAVTVISASNSQLQFSFDRGSGDEVIVLCREGYAVNAFPSSGAVYNADSVFGNGSQIGTGNYVVYKSGQIGRNTAAVSGLTNGKVYYFAVFEYSTSTLCYKYPPLYFHAGIGGTVFKPGELLLLGFDTRVPGAGTGNDKIYISSLVDILPGTQFSLVSSRFEAGAPPNVRTNRWYNSGDYIFKDPDVQEFTWTGISPIPAGSVISIQDKFNANDKYDSVCVNGVWQPQMISDKQKGAFNLPTATTKGEQFYLAQGSFYPTGDFYSNRYNVFFGKALFGMSLLTNWVPFSASPGTASAGTAFRESRIPPDILCMNIVNTTSTVGAGVSTNFLTGEKRDFKLSKSNALNWVWKVGDSLLNITENYNTPYGAEVGQPLTIVPSAATDGTWLGGSNANWFDCSNWKGMYVPDSTQDVVIDGNFINRPEVNTTTATEPAVLYSNKAEVRDMQVQGAVTITLTAGSLMRITRHLTLNF